MDSVKDKIRIASAVNNVKQIFLPVEIKESLD